MTGPRVQGPDTFSVPVSVSALLVELVRRGLVIAPKPQQKVRVKAVPKPGRRRFWTAEEDATVLRMHAAGKSDTDISTVIGFNQGTVSKHRDALGLAPLFPGRPKKVRE